MINRLPRAIAIGWSTKANTFLQYKCNDDAANTTVTDDGTGATDGAGNVNTSNYSVVGKINDAFDFNGTSEYVDCNQTLQTIFDSPFSVAVWAKPNDGNPPAQRTFFGHISTASEDYVTLDIMTDGKLVFYYKSNGIATSGTTTAAVFADGATNWTHIVVNISVTQIDIYINGVQVAVTGGSMAGITMGDYVNTFNFAVGGDNVIGVWGLFFPGVLDDFRIHDRLLTQSEINGIYKNGIGTEAQFGN